jgi:hypothetical protein
MKKKIINLIKNKENLEFNAVIDDFVIHEFLLRNRPT